MLQLVVLLDRKGSFRGCGPPPEAPPLALLCQNLMEKLVVAPFCLFDELEPQRGLDPDCNREI